VIEDYFRFGLNDRHLMTTAKQLRHDLQESLAVISSADRHAARSTDADVGTAVQTTSEMSRQDMRSVVAANFKRVEQSLRSLEEFGKIGNAKMAGELEQLRYRTYSLEKMWDTTESSIQRLGSSQLYLLMDGAKSIEQFEQLARSVVEAGVHVIQLRDKKLPDRELLDRARRLRALTSGTETLFIMNDRADLARLANADGVHVGQEELIVHDARSIVGTQALIGVSTHSVEQAKQAVRDGAHYIGIGPTFASTTKQFEKFTGPELLRAVATEIRLPAFAIGGIGLAQIPDVLASGITRVAVSGAVVNAADPALAVKQLVQELKSS